MAQTLLTTAEVAQKLAISVRKVRELMAIRELRYVRVCRRNLIPPEAIDEFLERNTVAPLDRRSAGDADD
ncbi:helix-turn-helix domain-containing protein [Thioclava sp. 'Guangxiensis']|uniref:helix-turn-helix domain-containing protein n=1 Tax=Thioclava sp. 'Guangxiensis' TaxID=3149044 RepID=UPI003877D643